MGNVEVLFVYKDIHEHGGAPNDYLRLSKELSKLGFNVLLNKPSSSSDLAQARHLNLSRMALQCLQNKLGMETDRKEKIAVIVGFSSLYNVYISMVMRILRIPSILLPVNQINTFLDTDNPFEKIDVPIVNDILSGSMPSNKKALRRVANGNVTAYSYLQKIKRSFYRATLGNLMISNVSKVGVFSRCERKELNKFFPRYHNKCFYYSLGADVKKVIDDTDSFNNPSNINILMWCRIDPFYKGIYDIVNWIDSIESHLLKGITLNIAGPDYKGGYCKVMERIEQLSPERRGSINVLLPGDYTAGTLSLLSKADYVLSLSKWDGFPRTLREAHRLNKRIIANNESNFDQVIVGGSGSYIVNSSQDFSAILSTLVKSCVRSKIKNVSLDNQLSWANCAINFKKEIMDVLGAS